MALRFEILAEAAQGGMGTVFRARDHKSRHDVALKILDANGDTARFARESALLATINHPNIVAHVAHGDDYLAMEWVDGETLATRMRTGVTPAQSIAIARQLAAALGALHAASIVHRDVKPSNVMLVGDHVKLVDLGVARRAAGTHAWPQLTRTGALVGTAGYMAPEQARGDREIDARADLFALGCVLYECLTGTPAFGGASAFALRAKVLLHDPPRVRTLVPELPVALEDLVARLLARDPAHRPTAAQAEAELGSLALPAGAARSIASSTEPTHTSDSDHVVFAVLVLGDAAGELARRAGSDVHAIDGGAVVACATLADATRVGLELAGSGCVAIARASSLAEAIDRGARLLEQIVVAAAAAGREPSGAWIAGALANDLDASLVGERSGNRVQLRRSS